MPDGGGGERSPLQQPRHAALADAEEHAGRKRHLFLRLGDAALVEVDAAAFDEAGCFAFRLGEAELARAVEIQTGLPRRSAGMTTSSATAS